MMDVLVHGITIGVLAFLVIRIWNTVRWLRDR
jgi:hypothetical protein